MKSTMNSHLRIAALSGFVFVALGAFGAHGLRDRVTPEMLEVWRTAVFYQAIHTLVLGGLALRRPVARGLFVIFAGGIVIFSGSLYLYVLLGQRWLGAITPLGGLLFLAGWLWIVIKPRVVLGE